MIFSSLLFIFWFIPIFFAVYYLVPAKFKNVTLFVGSILFYAWGEPKYVLLILLSIMVNFFAGIIIDKYSSISKLTMIITLIYDFGMLIVFKYLGFVVQNINSLTGLELSVPSITLPLGISFYTFQIASYIIDLYRSKKDSGNELNVKEGIKAQYNIINLGTYLIMFPQLIAGPIVVYGSVEKELSNRTITFAGINEGIKLFVIGLTGKIVIANTCGILWDDLGAIGYGNISMPLAWLGMISYSLQIYFDFMGYSVMAMGLGRMLGFTIPVNFDHPYISRSVTDFWRRWHITLSSWFRDYVYIPLGGSRRGKYRTIVNLFIVWFLTGLWHGAAWNFVLWGLFFFVLLLIEKSFLTDFLSSHKIVSHVYTLACIGMSWIIFAITDFGLLREYFTSLICFRLGRDILYYLSSYGVIILIGILFCLPGITMKAKKLLDGKFGTVLVMVLLIICVAFLADAGYNPFLYFRF